MLLSSFFHLMKQLNSKPQRFKMQVNRRAIFFPQCKEKLGVPQNENVSVVLESDGTQVEDGEYFKTLANNTILLLLRHGERWCPTGVDIIRADQNTKTKCSKSKKNLWKQLQEITRDFRKRFIKTTL
ncbi:hypothetical protein K0M31_008951 [Melipona bicolor]|uniref:CIDE-N domain-containing protein n=1 Tax=Melipona bicolor TaxID=60889 RepID=A0AA40FQ67_9HYME|nr:hypothetical protein K0M31_008951 [Melipona bicolor]